VSPMMCDINISTNFIFLIVDEEIDTILGITNDNHIEGGTYLI
jgi:hypothetical protein